MNQPYSQWHTQNSAENLPLAARYQTADPIRWNGSMVYPMYTERVGPVPIWVSMMLLSAAPPTGLRGHGIGLSVIDGYIGLAGKQLGGVDVWSDALTSGITFEVFPNAADALFSLTPVWVDPFGIEQSWSGNYGMLIEQPPSGQLVLWCSVGEGPPNFANLVVELTVEAAPAESAPQPSISVPNMPVPPLPGPHVPAPTASTLSPAATTRSATSQPSPSQPVSSRYEPDPLDSPFGAPTQPVAVTGADEPGGAPGRDYRSALYELAVAMYRRGEVEQACSLWVQAADAGHATAAYDLGVVSFRRGDMPAAERWWRSAADRRESRAMIGLAELLERRGNPSEAQLWRARAADGNHSLSSG
ncbi:tetratricopeptide repeat protein [Nocardia australiensis]|uniref:tetratricopeptide repeat protein n=1 Tax=Nocardia australiensis TaxID=2887191 RepID=UPI001D136269|nr:hypothetical protein [Nocardia australiensis]